MANITGLFAVLAAMAAEIKVRHYSRKTLKTYADWSRLFQRFRKDKSPQELTTDYAKEYLTFLAVKCRVAASTQNQAFNSFSSSFAMALKKISGNCAACRGRKCHFTFQRFSPVKVNIRVAYILHKTEFKGA